MFDTRRAALRHADNRFGDALTKLAHEILRVEKYADMTVFLENNLARFAALADLAKDRDCEPSEDDDA